MNEILDGLYMTLPECGHTYGIQAISPRKVDNSAYNKLSEYFYKHLREYKWFRQGDSQFAVNGDKHWLFIEFLGMGLDDDSALEFCQQIASEIGEELKLL
jgi:hypothetical protein